MNNEYVTGLHKYLQGQYGSEFKLNEQQFQDKLNNDPNYVNGLHGYLQQQYGSEFKLTPEEFAGKVKKKDQFRFDLESGSRPIQPTSGSKTSQFKPQKFGEFTPLETKKEEDKIEFAGALPESEQKVLDILSQKPSLKFVEDEDLKAYIRQNPKAWTDELIKKNPSLKDQTIDGVLPGLMDEEPTIDNQGLKSIENANTLIDYTKSYDEAFDNMVKESDSFTDDDVKANPKKYRDAVMNDYLTYLKMVNGEDSQTYLDVKERLDYYNSLGDKLYNDSAYADDLKRYQDIQKQALSKVSNNSYSKSIAIENNYDWKYFSKKASNLDVKARNIEKQISELGIEEGKALSVPQKKKYEELMNQYNQVKQEFDKLSEETNITPEVIDQIRSQQGRMASVMNTIDFIDNDKSANAESIRQYKAEMEANKKAQEEFYNTEENGNLAATGKGVVRLGQQAAKTFVNGVFDIAKMPAVVGEAFGAKGYGWSDKLSETADNINSVVELYNPELDKSNFSGFMTLMNDAGQGLGSIAQFATAGSGASKIAKGLQLSEKGLMAANRAAQFTAAASTSTSSLYNDLMDAGLTPEEAARYSLGGGMVMGAAEMIVPEDELIKNTIKQSFISSIKSGATRKEAIENALGHLAKKSGQIIANSGKETFEEGVGSLAESMSKQVASTMTGKKIDGIWDLKNFNSDALAGGETAFILEMFKFGPRRGRYSNPFEEDLVGYLAENYNDMTETLANTHPEDYDKIADRYKKLKDIYEGLKNTPAFNKLSKTDQNHVLAQSHAKQVILENIKQSGLSKEGFKDEIANIDEDIFQTLNGLRSKDTWSDKSKKEENAVQKPSTEEVLPREQGATSETGGQPQGMGQSAQGQEATQEGEKVSQEGLTPADQAKTEAADIVAGLNAPNMLASTVYPVIGEVEAQMDNGEFVSDEKSTEAQDKLYELLGDIDAREDLTPEQKQQMSAVIENRIQKIQDYDYRTRTETSTTTQSVAAGVSPKTQKSNERAKTPIRTVAEEGVDVTYDGRPGRIELRDGQYVFVPKKLGAVQARPIVIGEAAQVNADSRFAGVENPTKGPNNSVANITLPNGSTLSILNDDLSIDVGLEIAKQEIGPAPQSLFDTVFEEIVTENKVEVPYLRETKPAQEQADTTQQAKEEVTPEATQEAKPQQRKEEKKPYTGTDVEARQLKEKYKTDSLKRRILDQAQRIASALGNNTQVYVYETTEEYNKAIAERLGEDQKESTNGRFLYGDGVSEIHIDLSKANEKTLPHEAIHAVLYKAFGDNQKLFQQFKDKLKPILAQSTVEELENFANQDSYIEQGVTAEEFLAELGGAMTAAGTRIPKNTLQKIAQLLNEFLSKITGGRFSPITTGEVIDLFNSMADAFASGKNVNVKLSTVKKSKASSIDSKSQIGKYDALPGAPKDGPIKDLVDVAEKYAKENKINYTRQAEYVKIDEKFSKRLAVAYEKMKDNPNDPQVKKAYAELIKQTKAQYDALIKAGYEFNFYDSDTDPYDGNPMEAMRDLRNNKKMAVYGTYAGYGESGITNEDLKRNPMLASTGLKWYDQNGVLKDVTANDLFRAVHDAFGHGLEGAGFRARGEENAWQAHVRLFTGEAIKAITSETRGQNSWLNYGPYGEKNRTARVEDTVFADQKVGLMPAWTWTENVATAMPEIEIKSKSRINVNPQEIQANSEAKLNEVINGDPESGATFNLDGTTYDGGGLVIPITSVNVDTDKISTQDISNMVEDNIDKIFDDQKVKTGIYKFSDGKQISVDLNIIVPSEQVEFAKEFARAAGQESIFSLDTKENIKTGSTGENPIDFSADEFLEIAKALNEGRLPNIERLEYKPEFKSKSQTTTVYNASPKEISELGKRSGVAYFATNKREADEYARMNRGEVREFNIPNSDIQPEEIVIDKINELGLKPKDSSFSVDESSLFELIDDRFENSLSKSDIDKLFNALKKDGVKAFEYTDETQVVGGLTTSIAVIDNQYIQKLSTGLKSKSQAIPKATTESKSVVSELEMASNKTGLAKENAVKRFIEKYGEKGVVAKEISDKFDKIQEELGITKICNI